MGAPGALCRMQSRSVSCRQVAGFGAGLIGCNRCVYSCRRSAEQMRQLDSFFYGGCSSTEWRRQRPGDRNDRNERKKSESWVLLPVPQRELVEARRWHRRPSKYVRMCRERGKRRGYSPFCSAFCYTSTISQSTLKVITCTRYDTLLSTTMEIPSSSRITCTTTCLCRSMYLVALPTWRG